MLRVFCLFLAASCGCFGAGRQLTGPHAPASSEPLPPADAQKRFVTAPGFEVRLFAAEPDVVNPVGMTWDERGRLWVLELFEYPLGAARGAKPRDRIRILEDTDNDGRADKVTLFADGLNLATGLLLGNGGVYVGQAPYLLFLRDTNGDGVADERTVLLEGFGLQDRHELLNGFTWGPDGWLYMTHGVFTHSKVKKPSDPDEARVTLDAGVGRYHPGTGAFEVFADGTSNPWSVDFDRHGNAFVSACVIDHLFHMAPGGLYARQAGNPSYPYAYELLPSIVDHKHYRAAYCGIQIYQGDQYPAEYLGRVLMGNIHANSINQDRLTAAGASFKASALDDFLRTDDGWFRPISEQVGPDGAVWIGDWYDKYPCYQNANADPEGVDREYGRIWRVVHVGDEAGKPIPARPSDFDLSQQSTADLVKLLSHSNVWQRRIAQRLLSERRDGSGRGALEKLVREGTSVQAKLAGLWTLHGADQLRNRILDEASESSDFAVRAWAARLTGERRERTEDSLRRLERLAGDSEAPVRMAVVTAARQFVSGALTVNKLPADGIPAAIGGVLGRVIRASAAEDDRLIGFAAWMAGEPLLIENPREILGWLLENGPDAWPMSGGLIRKSMRRLCDTREPAQMDVAVDFLNEAMAAAHDSRLVMAALDGLIAGQKTGVLLPAIPTALVFAGLLRHQNGEVSDRARQLGALWNDGEAVRSTLAIVAHPGAPKAQRKAAIEVAQRLKTDAAREALLALFRSEKDSELLAQAVGALNTMGGAEVSEAFVGRWKDLPPPVRRAAMQALASRAEWVPALLDAIERKQIAAGEIPVTVIRSFVQHEQEAIRERAGKVIGRVREPDANMDRLIAEKKRVVLEGPGDVEAGRKVAESACFVCHRLHEQGGELGPDLTGVGRANLDALLANVINPNQLIGAGYENVEVTLNDGRTVSGRMLEKTDNYVKMLSSGPREETLPSAEIESIRVTELSVMPEGLEQMPDADFRNLIWFILNPPEDKRPMTPDLMRELFGEARQTPRDQESVALWNPEWKVTSSEHGNAPSKLPEFAGKENVLLTHPFRHQGGAAIERKLRVPAGKRTSLEFDVGAMPGGKWVLRVFADEQLVHRQMIDAQGQVWKKVTVDLSRFGGKEVGLRLENYAFNLENDYGLWSNLRVVTAE